MARAAIKAERIKITMSESITIGAPGPAGYEIIAAVPSSTPSSDGRRYEVTGFNLGKHAHGAYATWHAYVVPGRPVEYTLGHYDIRTREDALGDMLKRAG